MDHGDLVLQDGPGVQVGLSQWKSKVVVQLVLELDADVLHFTMAAVGRQCLKLFSAGMTSGWIDHVHKLHVLHEVVVRQLLPDS